MQEQLHAACREDFLFYLNTFVWQFNPRRQGNEVGPFISWDLQDKAAREIIDCVGRGRDLVIEKSREMGASWLCLLVFEWLWHFHPWKKFLIISRNEAAVEAEDPDSLFWKLDFVHRMQPAWLRPRMTRRKLFFGNDNGSTITGQATTGKAGVGGRATAMLIDEFSQIEQDYEVLNRTADTTSCRIFNFTHVGVGTAAFELTERVDVRKLVMHWTGHPEKRKGLYRYDAASNKIEVLDKAYKFDPDYPFVRVQAPTGGPFPGLRSPWYDRECDRRKNARAVAMDLDIDAKGSASQFFSPLLIADLISNYCYPPVWVGEIHYERDHGRPLSLVESPGGNLSMWLTPGHGMAVPAARYAIGCDLAAGTGATPSCVTIVNALTGERVAEYITPHKTPDELAPIVVALCWVFKDAEGTGAMLAWEQQGPGVKFGQRVIELGYRNVYYRTDDFTLVKVRSDRPGWVPNATTKRLLLEDYRVALSGRQFLNRSEAALKETLAFAYNPRGSVEHGSYETDNDPTGARENHSDRVIADALAWKMAKDTVAANRAGSAKKIEATSHPNCLLFRRKMYEAERRESESWG